jgi:ferric-dicitrate binding protein FerR (iron transport regulator)
VYPAYDTFTTTDFLLDDAFVDHQLAPTEQSTAFWADWLATYPHKEATWYQAVNLVRAIEQGLYDYAQTHLPDETVQHLLVRIRQTNALQTPEPVIRPLHRVRWLAAASIVLLSGVGLWWYTRPISPYKQQLAVLTESFSEVVNDTQAAKQVDLPDQSTIVLAPESRVSYPSTFGQKNRTVYLSGEATFAVTKNAAKPFLVYANELVTKVLGTRFVVRAFAGENDVQVKVQSGQVAVYRDKPAVVADKQQGVLLLPNQQVVFNRQSDQFIKQIVDLPQIVVRPSSRERTMTPAFTYTDTPIPQVIQELQDAYGIDIRYNKDVLANCQLTASLLNEPFVSKLRIICATVGATYDMVDGQVVITGGSCQ